MYFFNQWRTKVSYLEFYEMKKAKKDLIGKLVLESLISRRENTRFRDKLRWTMNQEQKASFILGWCRLKGNCGLEKILKKRS